MKNYGDFSGVILAGGRSKRMGFPKAFLSINGKRVIDYIVDTFNILFDEIFIITDDKDRFAGFKGVGVIEDLVKGCGPLGGIYTGLNVISNDRAFFAACDMPFLHIGFMCRLLDISRGRGHSCTVPYSEKGIEPLHAVYSRSTLQKLKVSLNRGELSVMKFLNKCNCRYINVRKEELRSFFNINTQDDLRRIRSYESKV